MSIEEQPRDPPFAAFERRPAALLTSYKRDGTPVDTPVTIAVEGGRAFFRTYDRAWKAKRIGRDPRVTIVPSTFRGRPRGEPLRARARLLEPDEARHAARAIARRQPVLQGVIVPLTHRLRRYRTLHYELVPSEPSATAASSSRSSP